MDQARGRIIELQDELASVEVDTASFCARCAQGKGCGAGMLWGDSGQRHINVAAPRRLALQVGDRVALELAPQSVLHAAGIVYGIPLVTAALAAALAWVAGLADGLAALAGLVGVLAGIVIARWRLQRRRCLRRFTPVVTERLAGTV
jgi:sigma-E factor negative regulatory protein RseC